MSRQIAGLKSAWQTERPEGLPKTRYRGARRAGLSYETAFGKALTGVLPPGQRLEHNPWFAYVDANGKGLCSPDYLWTSPSGLVVFECKLSLCEEAWEQLERLYLPVVGMALARPVRGIIVTKCLTQRPARGQIVDSLVAALAAPDLPVLHWLPRGGWFGESRDLVTGAGATSAHAKVAPQNQVTAKKLVPSHNTSSPNTATLLTEQKSQC